MYFRFNNRIIVSLFKFRFLTEDTTLNYYDYNSMTAIFKHKFAYELHSM